jgi:hypothetical protein
MLMLIIYMVLFCSTVIFSLSNHAYALLYSAQLQRSGKTTFPPLHSGGKVTLQSLHCGGKVTL